MRSVQQGYLAGMIRGFARHKQDIQSGLVGREFPLDLLRRLNDPQMEYLGLDNKLVIIAYPLMNLVDCIFRISRNDAVDKRAIDPACRLEPFAEAIAKVPELYIPVNAFLKFLAVQENKLAREDDEPLGPVSLELLVTAIQKLRKLAGVR